MEFKERLKEELGDDWPKNPKFSAITNKIILSQKDYAKLQITFTWGKYNMWCTGVNKKDTEITSIDSLINDDNKKFIINANS